MALFESLGITTSYIGIPASTVISCTKTVKNNDRYSINFDKSKAKKIVIGGGVGTSVATLLHQCMETNALSKVDLYKESLTESEIEYMEQLVAIREQELSMTLPQENAASKDNNPTTNFQLTKKL